MKHDTMIGGIVFRYCSRVQESIVYSHKDGCLRQHSCEHSTGRYCIPEKRHPEPIDTVGLIPKKPRKVGN